MKWGGEDDEKKMMLFKLQGYRGGMTEFSLKVSSKTVTGTVQSKVIRFKRDIKQSKKNIEEAPSP